MGEDDLLPLLGRAPPRTFVRHAVTVPAGGSRAYDEDEWRDALVVVQEGVIELEPPSGDRVRLECGAILWLTPLRLVALHNPGTVATVLLAVARRAARPRPRSAGPPSRSRPGP